MPPIKANSKDCQVDNDKYPETSWKIVSQAKLMQYTIWKLLMFII